MDRKKSVQQQVPSTAPKAIPQPKKVRKKDFFLFFFYFY